MGRAFLLAHAAGEYETTPMGFEDRDYYRNAPRPDGFFGAVGHWLLYGRVPLFELFGIRVQMHSSLVITMVLMLLLRGPGFTWQDQVISAVLLFLIVLLHEFGHCFGARWSGGDAEEIVLHPLGGLALTRPLSTWRAHFITTVCGPLVNVAFCVVCGIGFYMLAGFVPWKPYFITGPVVFRGWFNLPWLLFWLYQTNWMLLLFNLLPIYPLDGGRMTQELLWPRVGYYRSMLLAVNVGIIGAGIGAMLAIVWSSIGLLLLAIFGIMGCIQMKRMLLEVGPYGFSEYDDPITQSLQSSSSADRREAKRARAIAERQTKQAEQERQRKIDDEAEIDRILAKVSASGMHSLSRSEQQTLKNATERQQKRDAARR